MIYRSNLTAPDLTPCFKHLHSRVMGHSFGHDVPSDWADKADDDPVFGLYKKCGMWTHDEAAILYNVAEQCQGLWLDIGAHTGWTTLHAAVAGRMVIAVDPMLRLEAWQRRFEQNIAGGAWDRVHAVWWVTSEQYFSSKPILMYGGICVDGDHQPGKPLEDALNAVKHLEVGGVILFHDFMGLPVREAVLTLITGFGMKCRVYLTPHGVAVCWLEANQLFQPPYHIPDPNLVMENLPARWDEFNWKPYL